MVAGMTGACDVIATDGDDKSVSLTALNIANNDCSEVTKALKLYWGDVNDLNVVQNSWSNHNDERTTADIIIASDVAGCPYVEAYTALIDTLVSLSDSSTVIYMACQKRHSSENDFFEMLKKNFRFER